MARHVGKFEPESNVFRKRRVQQDAAKKKRAKANEEKEAQGGEGEEVGEESELEEVAVDDMEI